MRARATTIAAASLAFAALIMATVTPSIRPVSAAGVPSAIPKAQMRTCPDDSAIRADLARRSSMELAKGLFVLHVYGSTSATPPVALAAANRALYGQSSPGAVVKQWRPAGVIIIDRNAQDAKRPQLKTRNVVSAEQVRAFTSDLRRDGGDASLLVAIDQEGGRVNRLRPIIGSTPSAAEVGLSRTLTESSGRATAATLASFGINVDFAPVADVVRPDTKANSVIGDRSFGTDPSVVADRVELVIGALQNGGVAAVAKHWPGHGSVTTDSHLRTPVVTLTEAQLADVDLKPFDAAINAGVAAIMVGHLAVPVWDPFGQPATVSRPILEHLTRNFCGVVVSDSLWMGGVRGKEPDRAIPLKALLAGVDMFVMPVDLPGSVKAIAAAADRDRTVRSRLLDAATRVEQLRRRFAR